MRCSRASTRWPADAAALLLAILLPAAASAAESAPGAAPPEGGIVRLGCDFVRERARELGLGVRAVSLALPAGITPPNPEGSIRFRLGRPPVTGALAVTAIVEQDGRPVRALVLTGTLIVEADVSVAARDLARGTTLEEGDVRVETRALPEGLDPKDARARVVGRETRSAVAAGTLLVEPLLASPREVLRGQSVTLVAEGRGFTARVSATAARDGVHGERIPVVNSTSGQTVLARVVGRGLVRLEEPALELGRLDR
ncbi:MAG: flagellar basal body P-ring formation protein FlgA [Acidobacteria bacterium]|nr:flagellar basal body P-ring formation protein FlgA [Acidobacteriota bacterium]